MEKQPENIDQDVSKEVQITEEEIKAAEAQEFVKLDPSARERNLQEIAHFLTPEGREGFAQYCLKYFKSIVNGYLGQRYRNDVEDVVQAAAFKADKYLKQFDGRSNIRTWLHRICINEIFDYMRKVKSHRLDVVDPLEELIGSGDEPGESIYRDKEESFIKSEVLLKVMEKLKPYDRQLIVLYYLEENSVEEVAEMLEVPENTIKVQIYRIRLKMKKLLERRGVSGA